MKTTAQVARLATPADQLANTHRANKPLAKKLYRLMNGLRHPG
jgi:hypothetical protein